MSNGIVRQRVKKSGPVDVTGDASKLPIHYFRIRAVAKVHPYTILDSPEWHNSQFFGFYVLFWVVLSIMALREMFLNVYQTGTLLPTNIPSLMLHNIWKVALADLGMYLGMYVTFAIQVLVRKNYINWSAWGWLLSHAWIWSYIVFFIWLARYQEFAWIAQIFLLLHVLMQAMKQHSYAVFNGYAKCVRSMLDALPPGTERDLLRGEIESYEDHGKAILEYPKHQTIRNFFWYTMYPTCIYELDYPLTERIRWGFVLNKLLAIFGILFILILLSERYLYPLAIEAMELRKQPLMDRLQAYPLFLMELFPPFCSAYILVFYLIWDAVLNAIAELSQYNDRLFYRDWWNSATWDAYARDWNVPVHNFLLRHVYRSSIVFMHLSKIQAVFLTFIFSSLIHELAMYVIFGRLRGYLLLFQMLQIPLQLVSSLKVFKQNRAWGIAFFWFGIAAGPSILCTLYLMI